ncbi:MAG: hypothetical protein ACOYN2_03035 [Patescibacteria group bacterium]
MMLLETPYALQAAALQHPFTPDEYIIAGGVLGVAITIYLLLPMVSQALDSMNMRQKKREKKQALSELIIMKDIQTEIDEEMKQAMIRSALREKGSV